MISLEAKYPKRHINQWHNMQGLTPRRVIPRDTTSKEGSQPNIWCPRRQNAQRQNTHRDSTIPQILRMLWDDDQGARQGLRLTIYSLHCVSSMLTLQMEMSIADGKKGWAGQRGRSCEIGSSCFGSEKLHAVLQSPVTGTLKDTMAKKVTFSW